MNHSRRLLDEFGDHLMTSVDRLECGETWSIEHGWRAYVRVGKMGLVMSANSFRRLGYDLRNAPDVSDEIKSIGDGMVQIADAVQEKNDNALGDRSQ